MSNQPPTTRARLSAWWTRTEDRVRAGMADSARRHPRIAAALRAIVRYRLWIIGAAALAMAIVDGRGSFEIHDPQLFIDAGKKLFSGDALNLFADKTVQEGPLGLLFWGVIGHLADLVDVDPRMIAALIIYPGFTFAVVLLIRSTLAERNRPSEDLELFAAAIVLFAGLAWTMLSTGHIAEGVIPLLWFQAARDARQGRLERAGLLIAISTGLKLWGILGIPILLLNPDFNWRKLMRAGAVTAAVAALVYAPFVLFGEYNSLDYRWPIADSSLIHNLFPDSETSNWRMRAAQTAFALTVGTWSALYLRGRNQAEWAIPLVLCAAKLAVDPIIFEYYETPLAVSSLVAGSLLLVGVPRWYRIPLTLILSVLIFPGLLLSSLGPLRGATYGWTIGIALRLSKPARRPTHS